MLQSVNKRFGIEVRNGGYFNCIQISDFSSAAKVILDIGF